MSRSLAPCDCEVRIREIFSPFVDTSSELSTSVLPSGNVSVSFSRRFQRETLEIGIDPSSGELAKVSQTRKGPSFQPLRTLLARARFGDLQSLARSMRDFLEKRLGDPNIFVEGKLRRIDGNDHTSSQHPSNKPAQELFRSALSKQSRSGTQLFFLHGNAGSGKSWMLMHAAFRQAREFLAKETDQLYLYVDAQGVNLRSLAQQISYQLDVYNGVLRFGEVVPLIRVGALALIVDGFDELIMPSGLNDTLSALCGYLEDLEGEGSVLISARTAFFHTYDLQAAGVRMTRPLKQSTLEIVPWGPAERSQYCNLCVANDVVPRLEEVVERNTEAEELLGRPFVVSQLVNLLLEDRVVNSGEIMFAIEEAFLNRERTEKLLSPDYEGPLLSERQFRDLLIEIALEMWHLHQTSIDRDSLRTLTGILVDQWKVPRSLREAITQKIELNPILQLVFSSSGHSHVQFPHEILFSRFLARAVIDNAYVASGQAFGILREAPLGTSVIEQIALLGQHGESATLARRAPELSDLLRCIEKFGEDVTPRPEDHNVRLNLGSLATALLGHRNDLRPLTFRGFHFSRARFESANLSSVTFQNCTFEDVDARSADWTTTSFESCGPIQKLVIQRDQSFPESLPDVLWLVVNEKDSSPTDHFGSFLTRREIFPSEIELVSERPEVPSMSARGQDISELVQKIARRAIRVFWISLDDDDSQDKGLRTIKRDPEWPTAVRLLEKHSLARRSAVQRQGACPEMIHVERPQDLLRGYFGPTTGLPANITAFWKEVRSL